MANFDFLKDRKEFAMFAASAMEAEKVFPLTEEGRLAMKAWLEENI